MAVYPPDEPAAALQLRVDELDVEVPRIPIRKQPVRFGAGSAQMRHSGRGDSELSGPEQGLGAARNGGVPEGAPLAGHCW